MAIVIERMSQLQENGAILNCRLDLNDARIVLVASDDLTVVRSFRGKAFEVYHEYSR